MPFDTFSGIIDNGDKMCTNQDTHHICPWWLAYFFDNPLRRIVHSPRRMFAGYLSAGMTAVDIGCGMGFFSIAMAKTVEEQGKVLAVDIQPQMLSVLRRRAERAGVGHIIDTHLSPEDGLGISLKADFVLLFWSLHEIPGNDRLAREIADLLQPGGICFVAEPALHVDNALFSEQIGHLEKTGLAEIARPKVALSRAVALRKP